MLKRSLLAACLLLGSMVGIAATIDINGTAYPVDTLEHYVAGPGTMYTRFNVTIGNQLHKMYLLTVDLTNPYNKVEEYQSQDRMGATERMDAAHSKIDSVGHRPIGSVNCNFWIVSSQATGSSEGLLGQPFAGTAKDGMLIGEPESWNSGHGDRGFVMIDEMKRALIRNMEFNGRVAKGTSSAAIRDVNRNRVNPNGNEIALFNRYCGAATRAIADTVIEVVFDAVDGWAINDSMKCVVLSRNTTGGTALTGNMGALQGRGSRGDWCRNHLAVGDTFQIKLGMYSKSITSDDNVSGDSIAPHVMQMVTGNCLVMADGVLTSRNTNEDYNNRNYPRTVLATNNEGNRFWMLVSQAPGNYTAEMCGILRNDGATWAAGMDGGGSAQMNLYGQIINPTTEATPRAVANAMFVVSTAPEDSTVATLRFVQPGTVNISSYASYTPALRAYNQYDALLTHSFQDYTLTCEPASLGTISADGKVFIAGSEAGSGMLLAHYGSVVAQQPVVIAAGSLQPRVDSLWTDTREYPLEVISVTKDATYSVHPSHLAWTVDDPTICSIDEQGVLRGLTSGVTVIHGQLADLSLQMVVTVEVADNPILVADSMAQSAERGWTYKTASCNVTVDTHNGAPAPDDYTLNYSSTRGAYFQLTKNLYAYGCPDSMLLTITTDMPCKMLAITMQAHNADKSAKVVIEDELPQNAPYTYRVALNSVADITDLTVYPICVQNLRWTWQDLQMKTDYHFSVRQLAFVYGNYVVSDLQSISSTMQVYPNPATDVLHIATSASEAVLYSMDGRRLLSAPISSEGAMYLGELPAGTYLLRAGDASATILKQ